LKMDLFDVMIYSVTLVLTTKFNENNHHTCHPEYQVEILISSE
jgi:hypothetical protein